MKKTTKRTVLICSIFMAAIMLLGFVTAGFQQWSIDEMKDNAARKVNPDNFYTAECLTLVDSNTGDGIAVDVNEKNGVITLDGTADTDITLDVGSVVLNKGEYTLTAIDGASNATIYMTATVSGEETKFDFTPGNTITISADNTSVDLTIYIKQDTKLNNLKVLPVIVEGEESASYWN